MTQCKTYLLGDLITQRKEKNNDYDVPVLGVSREGFISPKQEEADRRLYNTFYLGDFVFNPARMEVNSIAYNAFYKQAICSSLYEIFYVNRPDILLPEFLNMIVKREEFARLCAFLGSGSAREYCRVEDISRIELNLPSTEEQKKAVEAYAALRDVIKENESLAEPLFQLCRSKIQDLKKSDKNRLGNYISIIDNRNKCGEDYPVLGINREKEFMPTVANVTDVDTKKYKVVSKGQFVFSGMQTGRDICIRLALYSAHSPAIVSPAYTTFVVKPNLGLLPEFLFLYFNRFEMDRYGWFISDSSVRSNLDWERFVEIQIPVPELSTQQAIVDIYNCAQEAKRIASEADKLSREICPALMQKAIHS